MLAEERRLRIVDTVERAGTASVQPLADAFGVSTMTIRRDLQTLEREGRIRRVHGGAIVLRGRGYEPPFPSRADQHLDEKRRIARRAADLVADGDTIVLDIGTTILELARCIRGKHNLTVLATSLQVANELASDIGMHLIVLGGVVRYPELSITGSLSEEMLRQFSFDKAFISASGFDLDGITGFSLEDSFIKSILVQRARQRILLADHSKFGIVAFRHVAPLTSMDTIITDANASEEMIAEVRSLGGDVLLA